jgi:hypothetical protein
MPNRNLVHLAPSTVLIRDVFDTSLKEVLAMLAENLMGDFLSVQANKKIWISFLHAQMEREQLEQGYSAAVQGKVTKSRNSLDVPPGAAQQFDDDLSLSSN